MSELVFAHVDVRPDDLPAVGVHGVDLVVAHVLGDDLVVVHDSPVDLPAVHVPGDDLVAVHDSRVDLPAVHVRLSAAQYVWEADRCLYRPIQIGSGS